jgi:uncharacterized protein YvpB
MSDQGSKSQQAYSGQDFTNNVTGQQLTDITHALANAQSVNANASAFPRSWQTFFAREQLSNATGV